MRKAFSNKVNQDLFIGAGLILLNLLLKGYHLTSSSIGGDEPFSIYHAQLPLQDLIAQIGLTNNPPLFELLLHFVIDIGGDDPFAVRALSLIAASITVVFVYRIGKDHFSFGTGLCASLLFTFSSYSTEFAHEARVYALFGLLATGSMYFYLRFIKGNNNAVWLMLVVNAVMLYAHYFAPFVIFVQSMHFMLYAENRKQHIKLYLLYCGLLLLSFTPQLLLFVERFTHSAGNGTWVSPPDGIEDLYNKIWHLSNQPLTAVVCSISSLLGVYLAFKRRTNKAFTLLVIWFFVPLLIIFFASYTVPMFVARYLMFLSTGLLLLVAAVAHLLWSGKRIELYAFTTLILLFVFTWDPLVFNKRPAKEVVEHVKALRKSEQQVIIHPEMFVLAFTYHYDRDLFRTPLKEQVFAGMDSLLEKHNMHIAEYREDLPPLDDDLIFLNANGFKRYEANDVRNEISRSHAFTDSTDFPNIYTVYSTTE